MKNFLIKPLFIFSLPRSGSTLVQRVLGASSEISTASEPWLLLALLGHIKGVSCHAVFNHRVMAKAIDEMCDEMPNGMDDYYAAVREISLGLYSKLADENATYFLDKTPRYHLISNEIIKAFPDGKIIFLWRNPLAVAASLMETWSAGRWNLYLFKIDLYEGLASLIEVYSKNKATSFAVCYEDLLSEGEEGWRNLFSYLEIPFDPEVMVGFKDVELKGSMRDPTGITNYETLDLAPIEKWKKSLRNPIRKIWCRRYLRWIGRNRLAVMGYKLDGLIDEIDQLPVSFKYLGTDVIGIVRGILFTFFEVTIFKDKLKKMIRKERIYGHF